jgi:hypothetical protein
MRKFISFASFTLVEMLIVIVIIWILTVALVPRLRWAINRAKLLAKQTDCRNVCQDKLVLDDNFDIWTCLASCTNQCDTPDITIGEYIIMACNMWTTKAGTWWENYGAHYQRGRNQPFAVPTQWCTVSGTVCPTVSDSITASSIIWPVSTDETDYFIKSSSNWYDGSTPNTLRGTNATRQWPCPVGYHIPTSIERMGVITTLCGVSYTNADCVNMLMLDVLLPRAGKRDNLNAQVLDRMWAGFYRMSNGNNIYAPRLWFRPSSTSYYMNIEYNHFRSQGYSVRCFKD